MQVKDLSVKSEQLEEVRGGTSRRRSSGISLVQQVANGYTSSSSQAIGGINGSDTYSASEAKSSPITNQSVSISTLDQYAKTYSFNDSVLGIGFGDWF